ncbi:hypothetical protein VitviT2T_010325 [Vitis vinifera]|uniref:RanBD1 domain-containing protein n=2 Tax=Vitis vinifera TaxID=29760 RepID=A0ABY9C897_VITVI
MESDDICMDVLSRLLTKTLLGLKCVYKRWHCIISNRSFIQDSSQRPEPLPGFFFQERYQWRSASATTNYSETKVPHIPHSWKNQPIYVILMLYRVVGYQQVQEVSCNVRWCIFLNGKLLIRKVAVTTGEEDEDTILDLKVKLYRFNKEENQWKEEKEIESEQGKTNAEKKVEKPSSST